MPGRSMLGPEGYRYAFQGQEKDSETGKEAFELRLWDSRIGRWLTVDPYGQYASPYLGMGNNPMNGVDPDGGCFNENGNPCPDMEVGSTMTGAAGYQWKMTDSGWDRSDGYGVTVTPSFGDKLRLQSFLLKRSFNSLSHNNPYPEYRWDWFEDRLSGDKFYGIGSEEYGNTRGKYGIVYGSQDYNDWLIPGGGGGNLRFWAHKTNTLNHILRATRDGVEAYDQGYGLNPVLFPENQSTVTVQAIRYHLLINNGRKSISDTTYIDIILNGASIDNARRKDSVIRANENMRRSTDYWLEN